MLKRKNLIRSVICLSLAFTFLVGCGNSEEEPTNQEPTAEGTTPTVAEEELPVPETSTVFWLDQQPNEAEAEKFANAWTVNSGVEVKVENYADPAEYKAAIDASIVTPDSPGMFTTTNGADLEKLAAEGKIVDLSAQWPAYLELGVPTYIQEQFTIDGKTYAAPYCIYLNTCFYNKQAFATAGISNPPTTFDEFLADCAKLKAQGITPIGLKNDPDATFIWFQELVAAYDPQLYMDICNGTKTYSDPAMLDVMALWGGMIEDGYFAAPTDLAGEYAKFANGEVAMIIEPNSEVTVLEAEYGMADETMGTFPMPSMANTGKNVIFYEAVPIVVSAASSNKDSAIMALQNYYRPEIQQQLLADTGAINTTKIDVGDPNIKATVDLSRSENAILLPRYYDNVPMQVRDAATTELTKFASGETSAAAALANIDAAVLAAPAAVTPAAVTPAAVTPAAEAPAAEAPAAETPAAVTPAAVTPAAVTPAQ